MRILVVEDEKELADLTKTALERDGLTADVAHGFVDATELLDLFSYDVVVLDLGLPDGDGIALIRDIRDHGNSIPILIATARDALSDRLEGLNIGADDYLVKPFDIKELLARVRALLRRSDISKGNAISVGNLKLDFTSRNLTVDGVPVTISRRELMVLELLVLNVQKVVAKNYIEDKIYGIDDEPSSNPVPVHVHHLRTRLSNAGANVKIHTVRGIGYVLMEE